MEALDLLGGTEIVAEHSCWEMLATQSVGRVAFSAGGQIEIFPVNYSVVDGGIVFRSNSGRKMASIGSQVAFEVDFLDAATRCGWSVVVRGTARDVTQQEGDVGQAGGPPWAGEKDFVVRLVHCSVTGRRVRPRNG